MGGSGNFWRSRYKTKKELEPLHFLQRFKGNRSSIDPHHITQRGNRRQDTFFCADDYRHYIALMSEWCGKCGISTWAYCLITNHVHLIAVP